MDTILGTPSQIAILVQRKHVEPLAFAGSLKSYLFGLPHAVQTFISQTAHAIEGDLGLALLQENGRDFHLVDCILSTKVVDKMSDRQ